MRPENAPRGPRDSVSGAVVRALALLGLMVVLGSGVPGVPGPAARAMPEGEPLKRTWDDPEGPGKGLTAQGARHASHVAAAPRTPLASHAGVDFRGLTTISTSAPRDVFEDLGVGLRDHLDSARPYALAQTSPLHFGIRSSHGAFREASPEWPNANPGIAVGRDQIVLSVNAALKVIDRAGTELRHSTLDDLFAGLEAESPLRDESNQVLSDLVFSSPRVLYDPLSSPPQFLVTALATTDDTRASYLVVAASAGEDATAPWCTWATDARRFGPSAPRETWLAMDPVPAVQRDALVVALHRQDRSGFRDHTLVRLIERDALADTRCGPITRWSDLRIEDEAGMPVFGLLPARGFADRTTSTDEVVLAAAHPLRGNDLMIARTTTQSGPRPLGVDATTIAIASRVTVDEYALPDAAFQLGTDVRVDTGDARLRDLTMGEGLLVATHHVHCTPKDPLRPTSCIRVYPLKSEGGGDFALERRPWQLENIANFPIFAPSVSVNQSKDIFLSTVRADDSDDKAVHTTQLSARVDLILRNGRVISTTTEFSGTTHVVYHGADLDSSSGCFTRAAATAALTPPGASSQASTSTVTATSRHRGRIWPMSKTMEMRLPATTMIGSPS